MSCEDCIDTKMMMSGKLPDCVACGWVASLPSNYEVMDLIDTYSEVMTDITGVGMTGLVMRPNITKIFSVFELEGIDSDKQYILFQKIKYYINVASKAIIDSHTYSRGRTKATKKAGGGQQTTTYRG